MKTVSYSPHINGGGVEVHQIFAAVIWSLVFERLP